ncbi:cyclin-dependent kinase inhibitor 1C-like [Syngnathoides biaculeatus]|uniref:cyclin-dependent kinase inhibitor 1C-like n=1 Tax=Syngnathoides biaculeatus TaxID=300417 RepID=UPI002ADE2830|nr:cyclin-dependent kinase inhibitor 1C-like [Syngnathoides biaculeatus]XP_061670967.1 cyclin-dependent kinase inhibitor 1C-like [Syngnathoides biaculeatus]XP_061670968.1 cyclin-dependent kinase inhibitor 1C-like [Syngnathoides biaculeatus]XP_061670969.1 cyclin-dependent kinase inhibitor 1C-like [Syngnathoides biaculeatus]
MDAVVCRKSVRRDLFGAAVRERMERELETKLVQSIQEDTLRWNFSFQTETPLSGSLLWEKERVERTAAFYHESSVGSSMSPSAELVCEETLEHSPSANKRPAEVTPGLTKKALTNSAIKIARK